tara:strand:+ start:910 stop:1242 length:333 start_codon:yes stop_codon:yes gene_type:complete
MSALNDSIVAAEDAVRQALINALEEKNEELVPMLFETLNKLKEAKVVKPDYTFNLNSAIPGYTDYFGAGAASTVPVGIGEDVISFKDINIRTDVEPISANLDSDGTVTFS